MNIADLPKYLLVQPITNGLVAFYQLLTHLHIPYALGFAIILMTLLIRFILYPFTKAQLQTSQKLQKIQPHLSKIKEKHKNDMKMQQQATMALYKEHGVNPAAGCLPGVVQIVILLFGFYPAIREVIALSPKVVVSTINHMVYFPALRLTQPWDTKFFGLALSQTPAQLMPKVGFLILLLPLLTGALQFLQSKMMFGQQPKPLPTDKKKDDDFATVFQKQSLFLVPIMITYFSYQFPVGLSLYWNTFTLFAIVQQYFMMRENKKSAIIVNKN